MTRNFIALAGHLLAIAAVIAAVGLTSAQDASEGADKFTGELEKNATLRILENDTAIEQGYLRQLLEAFNEKYAGQGIEAVDANMDQFLDLENDGPYGYGPDVLYQANDMLMKYVDGRHIQPLPVEELECYPQIDERAWEAYKASVDGLDYYCGVPVNIQGSLLYYRKDLLPEGWEGAWDENANGIPDMAESWSAMYKFSLERKEREPGKYGYMKSLFDVYFSSGFLFSYGGYVFGSGGTDTADIGFASGDSFKGASVLRQLASIMNQEAIDDTITKNQYSKLAAGDYFATMTTPDVYTLFIKELVLAYKNEGLSQADAEAKAEENLVISDIPKLPASGDLSEDNPELIPAKMMGGINGYAVSAYTKYPNAALAFVDFATSYEMIEKRYELLGVVPARRDAAEAAGGLAGIINQNLADGNISVMPSVRAIAQVWTPAETFFTDVAMDPFREPSSHKYATPESFKAGLEKVDQQVYDAIYTLQ
ncbi:MAG: extracellular solute-binding protein [Clostridiales bacterium]|jgi:arabinogalactan oligomer/maltooligosaccharide transport system substrate-binding protein|nr:extracellular solute-binding protein [Clostridiales bacterium]